MNFSKQALIFGITGIAATVIGFIFSDTQKYPIMGKFSGVFIVAGVAMFSLSLATKWNPIA